LTITVGVLLVAAAAAGWWFILPAWVDEPSLQGQLRAGDLEWQGRRRHYLAYVPKQLAPAPDLVFVLHGSEGTGPLMRRVAAYGFDQLADQTGAVVVYPDGYERHWNDCRTAAPYAANRENIDDVGFLRAVSAALERELSVHFDAVFATGLSNGGQMALRLALEAPDWITAAAPIAANLPVQANFDCTASQRPTALLLMNGTEDPMNPYAGGDVAMFGVLASRGAVQSSEETVGYFENLVKQATHLQGTATFPAPATERLPDVDPHDGTRVVRRRWQVGNAPPIVLVTIEGGGHTIPHAESRLPRLLGRTSRDVDAMQLIWDFFAEAKGARKR
jgi:polyhydroxybutyrate depolymerase